jgi:threonine dehydrogenase-like Zn-dependent dehydrogenase
MAEDAGAITIDMHDEYVYDRLLQLTGGRGPDACIDAVGMEAHGLTVDAMVDRVKAAVMLATDRPHALRQAINCCRKGGTVSVPGVYGGFLDKVPFGAAMQKGLTFRMGQTHVHKYVQPLIDRIEKGEIDPSFVITHKLPLSQAPHGYEIFQKKQDGCIKIVLKPGE